ncbi:MAG: ribosome biogenesis GTP-binding protein YihA/YsxC [Myxococcota bacterium]|nr:ribosome biogenesis GTP-binding protein YihA/YsxC [Myxococcota bacterium]
MSIVRRAGSVDFLGSFPGALPPGTVPEVAFVGRSNVGKSSAVNAVLGSRRVARVSRRPGRTQAINLFLVNRGVIFADLPGYGYARVPDEVREQWRGLVDGYLRNRDTLRAVVLLVDARHNAQPIDQQLLSYMADTGWNCLVLATKVDRLGKAARKPALARLANELGLNLTLKGTIEEGDLVPFSAVSREGVDRVWDWLDQKRAASV